MLSRYGSADAEAELDRLGLGQWQARKARVKARIKQIADELIKLAAARELKAGETMTPPEGLYEEFCARFPYPETDDQERAIEDTLADLSSGRPVDRLVCGDVGFGKTEVALRAAFVAVMGVKQVAVVVPTTLLARQHYLTLCQRFAGYPVRVGQLSRLVSAKDAKAYKAGMADGTLDIVVGTHALLAKTIKFRDLGLLIIDEEQHFGVAHKERLKALRQELAGVGCEPKDLVGGLVDFPARFEGRKVWLCWKLGEPRLAWWHELQDGFAGRRPIDAEFRAQVRDALASAVGQIGPD